MPENNTIDEDIYIDDEVSKRKLKPADMVFSVGILGLIVGIVFFIRTQMLPDTQSSQILTLKPIQTDKNSTKSTKMAAKDKPIIIPPIAVSNPWEKDSISQVTKNKLSVSTSASSRKTGEASIKEPTKAPLIYHCKLNDQYRDYEGREIVYFKKSNTHIYSPAFRDKSWDRNGIILKEIFAILRIDKDEGMVEIEAGKWIPALAFATCGPKVK